MSELQLLWVEEVLALLGPSLAKLLAYVDRSGFQLIVLNPRIQPWQVNGDVNRAILLRRFFGTDDGKHDYAMIAISKARQTWKNGGLPNILIQITAPVLLDKGDTPYYGSFSCNGQIVAVSGLQPYFDQLVSMWVACTIQQVFQHHRQEWIQEHPDGDFLSFS